MSQIWAPDIATYAQHEPYLTPAEYLNSPTGVDTSKLIALGSALSNQDALAATIARASGWVDQICNQTLAASTETHAGYHRPKPYAIEIGLRYFPIVAITSISTGPSLAAVDQVPLTDLSRVEIYRRVVSIPLQSLTTSPYSRYSRPGKIAVSMQYVAGWANSLLTAASLAGATTVTVGNTLGIAPGMTLNIYDPVDAHSETVLVSTTTATTITVTTPLQFAHAIGVNISLLPPAVKQAAVLLTSALIKTKGAASFVIASPTTTPRQKQRMNPNTGEEEDMATRMLNDFIRQYSS